MREILKKNYGINILEYKEYHDGMIFFINGNYYYFTRCYDSEEYLIELYQFCNKMKLRNIRLHDFVFNVNGKLLSDGYVLFKINVLIGDITLDDIRIFNSIDCNEYRDKYIFMDKFWEAKIDYLEMQLIELSSNKVINNSFDYYVGIAENLILFLKKNYVKDDVRLCLSHRGLSTLCSIEFYNPLNIGPDIDLKDVAAYIRITNDQDCLYDIVEKVKGSKYKYFFVRMVFPFDYFYEVSNVLIDGVSDKKLINIINKVDNYEKFIYKMQQIFGIYIFSWIKKE